ncbi:ABC transporter ATP-binding protein [Candidatus Bathyarchaeota archaeon ex4484_135]|nr:MAG: ABC transporter ATP-binding protein [Candidatus Bathyarchaeota archaeon ex4484_135]
MKPIVLRNVTKRFEDVVAVNNISFEVEEGELFGLLGPNGAGKTTTIRMICGLLEPTSGTIRIFGFLQPRDRMKVSRFIGYMPQHFSLYEDLTVYENILFYASLYRVPYSVRRRRIEELLDRFLLTEFRDKLAGQLSGGTKRRLALATALVHNPPLVILDEPTSGVDPHLRYLFWKFFEELRDEGTTLLITTHYMDEAEFCERLAVMRLGRIIAMGTPREIKKMALRGELLKVTVKSLGFPEEALLGLRNVRAFRLLERNGDQLTLALLVDDAEKDLVPVLKELEKRGIQVISISPIYVSLEDAFLSLTGGLD